MNLYFIVFSSCILLYFLIRIWWFFRNALAFSFIMGSYAKRNNMKSEEILPLCRLYSLVHILFDLIHWDFTKYIVHKEFYLKVCIFHIDLAKKIMEDMEKASQKASENKNNENQT